MCGMALCRPTGCPPHLCQCRSKKGLPTLEEGPGTLRPASHPSRLFWTSDTVGQTRVERPGGACMAPRASSSPRQTPTPADDASSASTHLASTEPRLLNWARKGVPAWAPAKAVSLDSARFRAR